MTEKILKSAFDCGREDEYFSRPENPRVHVTYDGGNTVYDRVSLTQEEVDSYFRGRWDTIKTAKIMDGVD